MYLAERPPIEMRVSDAQLRGAGELAAKYSDVWIQSHVAENLDEIAWVKELFPKARSYLSVYDDFGLMRERAVYAHCIWLDAADRRLMHDTRSAAAVPVVADSRRWCSPTAPRVVPMTNTISNARS